MKASTVTFLTRYSLAAVLLFSINAAATAATVFINQSSAPVAAGTTVASARLRASNTSWDMGLSNGQGYARRNAIRQNLSNRFNDGRRIYSFSLQYRAGEGFVFSVRNNRTGRTWSQAWGTFTSSPGTRNIVSTLGGQQPGDAFNALRLEARAGLAGARTSFANLAFTSPDIHSATGNFYSGRLTNRTTIGTTPPGTATQDLAADVNLAAHSWTLTGDVSFLRNRGRRGADDVSFSINMVQATLNSAVPEPSSLAALALTAAGLLARRRR